MVCGYRMGRALPATLVHHEYNYNRMMMTTDCSLSPLEKNAKTHTNTDAKAILCVLQQCRINLSLPFLDKDCQNLEEGNRFNATIIKMGANPGLYFGSKLIITYSKYGKLAYARQVFDEMSHRNVISWTAIIAGYAHNSLAKEALFLFMQMQKEGVMPDHFTFSCVLSSCTEKEEGDVGEQLHGCVISHGLECDFAVGNSLIDMYVKLGLRKDAQKVFDGKLDRQRNVISWTSRVAGYAKCGNLEEARDVFDKMPERNVISLNAMMSAYTLHGRLGEALQLYHWMRWAGMKLTLSTLSSVLRVCARLPSLEQGKLVHGLIIKCSLFEKDVVLESTLIDMYAKCGNIEDAWQIFEAMSEINVVTWTAIIDGYGKHGLAREALKLFGEMQDGGIEPNGVTFLSVLSACSLAGLVDEGFYLFDYMRCQQNIRPRCEHYASMVDLLARAGCLEEAHDFINKMPVEVKQSPEVWGALLGACRHSGNVELAKHAAEHLFRLKPQNNGTYVALFNVYAAAGMGDHAAKIIKAMRDKGIEMEPGCSWIEVKKEVHQFLVGDRLHPQIEQIYATWETLEAQIKQAGHMPETSPVICDIEEEQREFIPGIHSEKLAIAFGLMSTPSGSSVRIYKNLRVCIDCHTATKFISNIADRQIIVRDLNRFHHFKNGLCSCGDYW